MGQHAVATAPPQDFAAPPHPRKHCNSAMAMKELFRDLRPLPLYAMLGLTLVFFTLELVVSHVTHALTLLVDSYHTLCNLIALTGCLISVKYGSQREHATLERRNSGEEELVSKPKDELTCTDAQTCSEQDHKHQRRKQQAPGSSERRLRNTFGWARVEVLVMLIGAVFLASLCFSLVVEAVQTLFHIGHIDEMHNPIIVMAVGALGLLLNGLCYILIGGYTFHQGSLLHVTPSGDVVLEGALSHDEVRRGGRRLSARRVAAAAAAATSAVQVAPAAQVLKESGRILLQTIPDYIDIESLKNELVAAFPNLVNVHEDYVRIKEELDSFFVRRGVTHATIQPEFCAEKRRSAEKQTVFVPPPKPPRQQQNEAKTESCSHKTDSESDGYPVSQRPVENKRVRHQRSFSAGSDPTLTVSSSGELSISQVRQHSLEEIPLP
ncbi:hypothetical protein B566_EDAN014577 [Ephemera danica]|nr:hypothetical protein B566_EDAN014577 [Ephemera danica]